MCNLTSILEKNVMSIIFVYNFILSLLYYIFIKNGCDKVYMRLESFGNVLFLFVNFNNKFKKISFGNCLC